MPENPTPTILNVNDDEATLYIVTRILQRAGYQVIEATTGTEGLKRANADHPALVVLDVNLPDINGIEVCQRIKANATTSDIPVLHLSATKTGTVDQALGLESGADAYLTQPVEAPVLTATIKALLRLSHAETLARSSAQVWEAAFGAIGDGVCLLDSENKIIRCNRAMAEMALMPEVDIVGIAYKSFLSQAFPGLHLPDPIDVPVARRTVVEAKIAKAPPVRWFRLSSEPVMPQPRTTVDVVTVCVMTDITESKETALRQRSFLRDMLASVTEARLRLCLTSEQLPECLPEFSPPIELNKASIRELRNATVKAIADLSFSVERGQDLETAVGEAAMNAVVHAGRGVGQVRTDGNDVIQIWIEDHGSGIAIDSLHRATLERGFTTAGTLGHGFWLMLKTCDRIFLLTGENGTTIVLEQQRVVPDPFWLITA